MMSYRHLTFKDRNSLFGDLIAHNEFSINWIWDYSTESMLPIPFFFLLNRMNEAFNLWYSIHPN